MITIRLSAKDDCLNVFQLSNMDYVREHSFHKEKLFGKIMCSGLQGQQLMKNIKFFIIEDTEFIGQVRLNITENIARISIRLLKEYQHKGIAYQALTKIIAENNYQYLAEVEKDNLPSVKLFERLDFIRRKEKTDKNYFEFEYVKK